MWKLLVNIGIDYVRKHLLPRLKLNAVLLALFDRILLMGEQAVERVTDSNPDNATQLRKLLEENYEELLSGLLAGGATAIKDSAARQRILAILTGALQQLKEPDPVA